MTALAGAGRVEARVVPQGCFAFEIGSFVDREVVDPGGQSFCVETGQDGGSCLFRLQAANQDLGRLGCGGSGSEPDYDCVFGLTVAYEYAVFYNCSPVP